jgi:hypothetical protein
VTGSHGSGVNITPPLLGACPAAPWVRGSQVWGPQPSEGIFGVCLGALALARVLASPQPAALAVPAGQEAGNEAPVAGAVLRHPRQQGAVLLRGGGWRHSLLLARAFRPAEVSPASPPCCCGQHCRRCALTSHDHPGIAAGGAREPTAGSIWARGLDRAPPPREVLNPFAAQWRLVTTWRLSSAAAHPLHVQLPDGGALVRHSRGQPPDPLA